MKPKLHHEIIARIFVDHANMFQRHVTKLITTTFRKHALGTLELELLVKTKWSDILSYEPMYGTETIFIEATTMFGGEVLFTVENDQPVTVPVKEFEELYLKYKLLLS